MNGPRRAVSRSPSLTEVVHSGRHIAALAGVRGIAILAVMLLYYEAREAVPLPVVRRLLGAPGRERGRLGARWHLLEKHCLP